MPSKNTSNHYKALTELLDGMYKPEEIGNQLDEIMSDLVSYAGKEESYSQVLPERHTMLRELRNIFWKLEKPKP